MDHFVQLVTPSMDLLLIVWIFHVRLSCITECIVFIIKTAGATRMDFQIPLSRFTEGRRNTFTLLFETLCSSRVQQAQTSVPITLPPPSSFRVNVISCDPLNTDPSFPVSLDIRADTEADQVVVRASSTTQSILLIQWSINGSSDDFRGK